MSTLGVFSNFDPGQLSVIESSKTGMVQQKHCRHTDTNSLSMQRFERRNIIIIHTETMYDHVRNTHWQMPGVSQRHRPYVQQRSNTYWPAIGFQKQVRDATAVKQVWRTLLLACRTGCMELTATLHSCCSQPCHVQETTQNALF